MANSRLIFYYKKTCKMKYTCKIDILIFFYFHLSFKMTRIDSNVVNLSSKIRMQRSPAQFKAEQAFIQSIINDPTHVLFDSSEEIPSGVHFRLLACKTNMKSFGYISEAVQLVNSQSTRDGNRC